MIITKNFQTEENIRRMAEKVFSDKKITATKELTEGMCNVAYNVSFDDGSECILKIASKDRSGNTSNEINLMDAEVSAMKLVGENTDIPVAKVYGYDTSLALCDGKYFFMEKIKGRNLCECKDSIEADKLPAIYQEIGCLSKKLTTVKNAQFGFLGDERRFDSLYEFVRLMLTNLIADAKKKNIDICYPEEKFLSDLEASKEAFAEVEEASLVHWDMWEGNIFVDNNRVSGIIDWERAMWGDPLQDDRFRKHSLNNDFLKGFGIEKFSKNQKTRLFWYDTILYLTMMIEVFYRGFEDDGQYKWARQMLLEL